MDVVQDRPIKRKRERKRERGEECEISSVSFTGKIEYLLKRTIKKIFGLGLILASKTFEVVLGIVLFFFHVLRRMY